MRMAGRMGSDLTTTKNIEIAKIDEQNNEIYLNGAVPGAKGSLVWLSCQGDFAPIKEEIKESPKVEEVKTETNEKTVAPEAQQENKTNA